MKPYGILACTIMVAQTTMAQTVVNMPNVQERPTMKVATLDTEIKLDGEVLHDEIWEAIKPTSEMWQNKPNSGFPATEKTEIRIGLTATTFYLAVVCYDKEPDKLVVSDARRDATLDNTDSFLFILDTYHDGQNGFLFGSNPIGIEYDGQVDNEGQGNFSNNRMQAGTVGGFNLNWDASWEVKSITGDFGWSAEFAIPLRTLRFASGDDQVWGINFQRNIRKTNEINYWAALPIQFDLKRLSLAGTLTGLKLKSPGNLKLIPYVLGQATKEYAPTGDKTTYRPAVGMDVKYSITPAVTLDLTYNTDFAQVEVDQQQINLDRFNLFFPEKRPFFLENAGFFSVGSPGEVDLFFTRKLGLDPSGRRVPIIGGGRLSGKVKNTSFGVLNMFTEEVALTDSTSIQKNNFSVARISRQFKQRSYVGAMFIDREGMGSEKNDYNRTFAVDGRWGFGKEAQLFGFYSKTMTPGDSVNADAFRLQANYEWNGLRMNYSYQQVSEAFNPEVGFLLRSAYRKPEVLIFKQVRMNGKFGLLEVRPHISWRGYWNFNNFFETSYLHVDNHWVWVNGLEIHTGINFTTEGVVKTFPLSKDVFVPAGTYNHHEAQIVFMTNASKPVYLSTRHILGGSFGGTRLINSVILGMRIGDKFNSDINLAVNDVRLPYGDFVASVLGARLSYSFRPRINLQSFIQYNSAAELWSANIRFSLLEQANTGLFIVYNEVYQNGSINNRALTIKYTRMFDVLGGR
jgi:Domain of unknown function (DUF5916)